MNRPIKVLSIVGARPQFVKAAMVSRAIQRHNQAGRAPAVIEEIVHTGQHYDESMSGIFFHELGLPPPVVNLEVSAARHGEMTGRMLAGVEGEILERRPDWCVVHGDTNSTLAGALAAAKLRVPLAHVEAGLRSFNRDMPEEINRVVTDHLADLLLCPTRQAVENLAREGIERGVQHVGDVMYDAARVFGEIAVRRSDVLDRLGLEPGAYCLATVHRAENTDDPARLAAIFDGLAAVARRHPVVLPLHPRTRRRLATDAATGGGIRLLEPVSFFDMLRLEREARVILTDSGGVQKEAYFQGVPCVTLRDETEWVETVEAGWNQLVGADPARILRAVETAAPGRDIADYGDGRSADRVLAALLAAAGRGQEES